MDYLARSDIWQSDEALKAGQAVPPTNQSRVLARFRQIFPLALFPDDLIVEELLIVWVRKDAQWSEEVISIIATDIASVDASVGPLFGRIHVKSLTGGPEILVDNLLRGDVYRIRCLVEGIALAARAGFKVDVEDLETKKEFLAKVGSVKLH